MACRCAREPKVELKDAKRLHHLYTEKLREQLVARGICSRLEYTGSAYEGVKVRRNDNDSDLEFDIMVILQPVNGLQVYVKVDLVLFAPQWRPFASMKMNMMCLLVFPLPSKRLQQNYDVCLEVKSEDHQKCCDRSIKVRRSKWGPNFSTGGAILWGWSGTNAQCNGREVDAASFQII